MTKTKKTSAANRRAEIIREARTLMIEQGYGALSLRAVAERVGIKLASLQYHVPTKSALLALLIEDAVEHYRSVLIGFTEDRKSPKETFDAAMYWLLEPSPEWNEVTRFEIQFWALAFVDETAGAALDEYLSLYRDFLADLTRRLNPKLSKAQARRRALAIASLLEGSMLFHGPRPMRAAPPRSTLNDLVAAARAIALAH
ncbi:TetR/AcrR family transcriptional regulator [Hyphococcus luteus]|uniref:HTH tetR-type domain-containing protein n=1 Tax=Hyphococcus luteus TaxID=2058213 RepID=A0A2S7K3I2_9PROT|nr:TetR/AcrR family transcriptional regulator [Marinicaulis flavus]PQA87062.1 hypothetical protein CW354_13505 [Marinicaulis flavus]